ncbi:MAG: hypothetical protein WC998_04980 [Candidatus Paceibacterota bacterium]|jgi:hypothetical protein
METRELDNYDIKKLVIARLNVMPKEVKISIGDDGEHTVNDLIEHVEKGDEIGEKMARIQMDYLRFWTEGKAYE